MELMVNILTGGSFARYTVKHEVDGIYIARLVEAGNNAPHIYPRKIFLHKDDDGWKTDHHAKEIGLLIGKKIDEKLRGGVIHYLSPCSSINFYFPWGLRFSFSR